MYLDRRWPPFALHEDLLLPDCLHLYIILVIDQLNLYDSLISFLYKPTTNSGLNNIIYIIYIFIRLRNTYLAYTIRAIDIII